MWRLVCWFWVIVGLGCGDVVFAGCGFGDTLGFLDLAWFGAALDLWVGLLSFVEFALCSDRWVYMAVTFIAGLRDLI